MNTHFDRMYECDRRTNGQTDKTPHDNMGCTCIASQKMSKKFINTFVHFFQKRHKVTNEQFTYWTRLKYFYLLTDLVGKTEVLLLTYLLT